MFTKQLLVSLQHPSLYGPCPQIWVPALQTTVTKCFSPTVSKRDRKLPNCCDATELCTTSNVERLLLKCFHESQNSGVQIIVTCSRRQTPECLQNIMTNAPTYTSYHLRNWLRLSLLQELTTRFGRKYSDQCLKCSPKIQAFQDPVITANRIIWNYWVFEHLRAHIKDWPDDSLSVFGRNMSIYVRVIQ